MEQIRVVDIMKRWDVWVSLDMGRCSCYCQAMCICMGVDVGGGSALRWSRSSPVLFTSGRERKPGVSDDE